MTPHLQVKLLELDAMVAAFKVTRRDDIVKRILRTGKELGDMALHISDNATLHIILDAILRADHAIKAECRRRGILKD
jgi:hypothetical protein